MSHSSDHQKTSKRRKSSTTQPDSDRQQASRRTSRKEAAQTRARKKRQLQLLIGGVAAAVIIAVAFILFNRPTSSGIEIDYSDVQVAQSDIVQNSGTPSADHDDGALSFATGSTVGDPNAPVTMHIFSDFQCHFCKSFHDEILPQIMDDFVRTGQVKLVFHDFPQLGTDSEIADPDDLSVELRDPNNQSSLSAQAAMCAGEQDEYLEMSDKLFGNYGGVQSGAFNRSNLNRFADDMGLEMTSFNACMDSGRYVPVLAHSIEQGRNNGITGTPTFILDNGSGNLNVFQQTELGYDMIRRQIEASIQTAP